MRDDLQITNSASNKKNNPTILNLFGAEAALNSHPGDADVQGPPARRLGILRRLLRINDGL
jgi:hypothetical protein